MATQRKHSSTKSNNNRTPAMFQSGDDPVAVARMITFFIENHLDYFTYPDHAATEEQIRFMVYKDENERYYPCSDKMFEAIMTRSQSALLQKKYNQVLELILALIEQQIEDPWEKSFLESLVTTKHKHETRDEIMIPSRLKKRLMRIYVNRTQIEDPFREEKTERNHRAHAVLDLPDLQAALNFIPESDLKKPPNNLQDIKTMVAAIEFKRLLCLSCADELWQTDQGVKLKKKDFLALFNRTIKGNGFKRLLPFLGLDKQATAKPRKILWLTDESGQIIIDLALIRFLVAQGHKVIVAFKDSPLFTKPIISDLQNDPVLCDIMGSAAIIDDRYLSKNELVRILRGDVDILALSDGTSENLNLLLSSTTFARVFKEVDAVISRGHGQRRRLFHTHFQFTQDIFSIAREKNDAISIKFKPRHPAVIKFSHQDLEQKAQSIINKMKAAKEKGMTVIFYSGIIGSIPGKIKMAKQIMSVFVDYLNKQSSMTFIINPSEYFEPGMDADDLMYMWEIVQRSGYIDIWHFQTFDDIATAFQIMDKKIPPEWVGKDATYSTGCTKEMAIAMQVQREHPEMQIIGPAKEKFMRRKEYGVGKMYDKRLTRV